jgi:hypothetical protein
MAAFLDIRYLLRPISLAKTLEARIVLHGWDGLGFGVQHITGPSILPHWEGTALAFRDSNPGQPVNLDHRGYAALTPESGGLVLARR